jgi:2-dehydro-3-deoxyphosphogluconate aldolase/(4S)-4-hydroxy-2-oxoglutarate aldolase
MKKNDLLKQLMTAAPVIPVIVIDNPRRAVSLSRALVAGGLPAIEITLRTKNAVACIKAVAEEVEGAIAGAGTVLDASQMREVEKAGARFMVSPGMSAGLLSALGDCSVPMLPGVATASEMMTLGEAGFTYLKFFPAEAAGGANFLKSVASPLAQFRFCPTGGISPGNATEYLALPNVLCVGGSWVAPFDLVEAEDWKAIEALARAACGLKRA